MVINKIKNISYFKSLIKVSEIIHCDEVVEMTDIPSDAVKNKKSSSMSKAVESVSDKHADAVLSFGNTGALMTFALLLIKTLTGIGNIYCFNLAKHWEILLF